MAVDTEGSDINIPAPTAAMGLTQTPGKGAAAHDVHPSGKRAHGRGVQILRGLALAVYFLICCVTYVCDSLASNHVMNLDRTNAYENTVLSLRKSLDVGCIS